MRWCEMVHQRDRWFTYCEMVENSLLLKPLPSFTTSPPPYHYPLHFFECIYILNDAYLHLLQAFRGLSLYVISYL